jgi:hypothetical protein
MGFEAGFALSGPAAGADDLVPPEMYRFDTQQLG